MRKTLVFFMLFALIFITAASSKAQNAAEPPTVAAPTVVSNTYIIPPIEPTARILSLADEIPAVTPSPPLDESFFETEALQKIDDSPVIALTFDDGPSVVTPRIIELLVQYDAAATFCVIGNRMERYEDTVRLIYESGSEIVGHSWSHRNLTSLSKDEITLQLADTNALIAEMTGAPSEFCRLPYGSINQNVREVCEELGLSVLNWSVDTKDWKTRDADAIYEHIMERAQDGAIILCHDIYNETAEAMERVIPELIEQGYRLVTVSELLTASGDELEPGKVYTKK